METEKQKSTPDLRVSIAGCASYEPEEVAAAMDALFAPLGALDWVTPGMRVAVKANLVVGRAPARAATTHPALVRELCRRLTARGASVVVGDSPGGPYSRPFLDMVYRATEMTKVTDTGAALNEDFGETEVSVPDGAVLHSFWCCDYLRKADAIIDFCKLKTHALTAYTGACKNMFGGMTGMHKSEFHYKFPDHARFAAMLVDLCEYFKPRLSICDGVIAMEGNGPSMGEPRPLGVLLASFNPHALDLMATHLIGLSPADVPTVSEAIRRGLIPAEPGALTVSGDPERFRVTDFKHQPPADIRYLGLKSDWFSRLVKHLIASRPEADRRCVGCGKCAQVCPAGALTIVKKRPRIDRGKCICCFCCSEFCPHGAMRAYEPLISRLTHGKRRK